MKKYKKHKYLFLIIFAYLSVFENGNTTMSIKDGVFGASGNHINIGRLNAANRSEITVETSDRGGESDVARMLTNLVKAGLIGKLEVRMEVSDRNSLSNAANDAFEEGDHKKAFDCYGILVALNQEGHIARYHLANYLMHGIRGDQAPNTQDRFRACQLLIETSWLEMTAYPDEPDNGGRLIRSYQPEVYAALSQRVTDKLPLEERAKQILQEQLFANVKDQPADPF